MEERTETLTITVLLDHLLRLDSGHHQQQWASPHPHAQPPTQSAHEVHRHSVRDLPPAVTNFQQGKGKQNFSCEKRGFGIKFKVQVWSH